MKRTDLVEILKRAAPALSTKELGDAKACFLFGDGTVQASDGVVTIRTPCAVEFDGGLRGRILLDFLAASRAAEYVVETDGDDHAVVRSIKGASKLRLGIVPTSEFSVDWSEAKANEIRMPEKTKDKGLADLRAAIERCSVSMGMDPDRQESFGITLAFEKLERVVLYSTNGRVATTTAVDGLSFPKALVGNGVILPVRFCELVIDRTDAPAVLAVSRKWVQAHYADQTKVHSTTVEQEDPARFRTAIFDAYEWEEGWVEVPNGLPAALDRALVIEPDANKHTEFKVTEGVLRIHTEAHGRGESTDRFKVVKPVTHPDVHIWVGAERFKKALPGATTMHLAEDAVLLAGENYRAVIGARHEAK